MSETSQARCPDCGARLGLGVCSDPGACPDCGTALMLTCEFRALTPEDLAAEARRRTLELASGGLREPV
jgi:predicted RNA-binding Zn-ribbon protein involved in translation (DUF1610 family)